MAESDYNVLVCAESKVSDHRYLSELRIPGFGCPQQKLRNSTPGAQGMALYVREGFSSFRHSKLECPCHEFGVFRIRSKINNFHVYMPFAVTRGRIFHFVTVSLTLMARVQSVDDKAVFVGNANALHSEWLESVSPTDRHGRDALDFLQSVRL